MQVVVKTIQPTYVMYVTSSFLQIATVYPKIGEPPSNGATQLIVTLMFVFTEVDGASGVLGGVVTVAVTTCYQFSPKLATETVAVNA